MRRLAVFTLLCVLAAPCSAYSNKEHILLTRIAAARLIADPATPPAMKAWLREATDQSGETEAQRRFLLEVRVGVFPRGVDGLAYWATVPDMLAMTDRQTKVQPFDVPERVLHYIDVEYFAPGATSGPAYRDDLSARPKVADFPREISDRRYKEAGMLPWRVEDCYHRLVGAICAGRLVDSPGQYPRDRTAARWAGMLAHYVQDGTQPQHATVDYKSASYFADTPNPPDIHSMMEYVLVDDDDNDYPALRVELWELFSRALEKTTDPATTSDPWQSTVEVSLYSYGALPLVGHAAAAAWKGGKFDVEAFFHFKGDFGGREMTVLELKAEQWALAVHRVQSLWSAAWREAQP